MDIFRHILFEYSTPGMSWNMYNQGNYQGGGRGGAGGNNTFRGGFTMQQVWDTRAEGKCSSIRCWYHYRMLPVGTEVSQTSQ